jgi:hypothetical protein
VVRVARMARVFALVGKMVWVFVVCEDAVARRTACGCVQAEQEEQQRGALKRGMENKRG